MQILVRFQPSAPLIIPYNYNYQLQSALYALLAEVGESDFWHDKGSRIMVPLSQVYGALPSRFWQLSSAPINLKSAKCHFFK